MKTSAYRLLGIVFAATLALEPVTALLWQLQWGWLRLNWILYPLLLASVAVALLSGARIPRLLLMWTAGLILFSSWMIFKGADLENLLRFFLALLPLCFVSELREAMTGDRVKFFGALYLLLLLVPVSISLLQIAGRVPYYDPGVAYDLYPGRISGGYQKPNNLCAILFPAYLYGYFLIFNGRRKHGMLLAGLILLIVLVSGLRTSVIAYGAILILALIPSYSCKLVLNGFRYLLFTGLGLLTFIVLSFGRETVGIQDGLRKRLPMWIAHADQFANSSVAEVLFGRGDVRLPAEMSQLGVESLTEVHNNDFRIIITFGVVGYLAYGLFLRRVASHIEATHWPHRIQFLQVSCLVHALIYSITNEPAFYPGILWPLIAWIIFIPEPAKNTLKE